MKWSRLAMVMAAGMFFAVSPGFAADNVKKPPVKATDKIETFSAKPGDETASETEEAASETKPDAQKAKPDAKNAKAEPGEGKAEPRKMTEEDLQLLCRHRTKGNEKAMQICMKKNQSKVGQVILPREAKRLANANRKMIRAKGRAPRKVR